MFGSGGVAGHAVDPTVSRSPGSGVASAPAAPEPGTVRDKGPVRRERDAVPPVLLDGEPAGAGLAAELSAVDEAALGDDDLVEVLAAWDRLASWAEAGAARALAALLGRTAGTSRDEFVADEVAARLGADRADAARRVALARGVARLPEVAEALATGAVDRGKAEALLLTGTLPDDVRRAEVRALLPRAGRLTPQDVREHLRRAELARDPDGARARHHDAREARSVRIEAVDDAMARLTAELPADDAVRVFSAVDAAADALREPRESRPPDAARADALVGVLTGRLRVEAPPDRERHPRGADRGGVARRAGAAAAGPPVVRPGDVHVTVAASTLLGSDDLPAILAGHGPVPAAMARALAGDPDAVWQRLFTDPGTGELVDLAPQGYRPGAELRRAVVATRDATCTFPGCRVPAERADVDLVAAGTVAGEGLGVGLHAVCATHRRAASHGGWQVAREATGATVWTTPTGRRHRRAAAVVDPRCVPPSVT